MVQSSSKHGDTPRTLLKIILMLGLTLTGFAAFAEEPSAEATTPASACAETSFDFGGRVIENGQVTDSWTLTCWRQPPQQADTAAATAAAKPVDAKSIDAVPVASQMPCPPDEAQAGARF